MKTKVKIDGEKIIFRAEQGDEVSVTEMDYSVFESLVSGKSEETVMGEGGDDEGMVDDGFNGEEEEEEEGEKEEQEEILSEGVEEVNEGDVVSEPKISYPAKETIHPEGNEDVIYGKVFECPDYNEFVYSTHVNSDLYVDFEKEEGSELEGGGYLIDKWVLERVVNQYGVRRVFIHDTESDEFYEVPVDAYFEGYEREDEYGNVQLVADVEEDSINYRSNYPYSESWGW